LNSFSRELWHGHQARLFGRASIRCRAALTILGKQKGPHWPLKTMNPVLQHGGAFDAGICPWGDQMCSSCRRACPWTRSHDITSISYSN